MLARWAVSLVVVLSAGCATGGSGTRAPSVDSPGAQSSPPEGTYTRVVVRGFEDGVSQHERGARGAKEIEMNRARRALAANIAQAIEAGGVLEVVEDAGSSDDTTLIIEGTITRYAAGNVVGGIPVVGELVPTSDARVFAATVRVHDAASGRLLTKFDVDDAGPTGAPDGGAVDASRMTAGPAQTIAARVLRQFGGPAGAAAVTP